MDKIASALVKAQKGFAPALKSATNPHFKSKYADLAACVEAVIDALNSAGVFLMQRQHPSEGGVAVETIFVHESGEQMSAGILHVPASKQDAQGYGSALTYARRYSLMAACGIAPEDDDGNAASKGRSGAIKPVAESLRGVVINESRKAELDEAALVMIETFNSQQGIKTLDVWRSITDNEERLHIWNALAAESKLRAFIKANKEQKAA